MTAQPLPTADLAAILKTLIMKSLIAVQQYKYVKPAPVTIFHHNVIELHPNETAETSAYNDKLHVGVRPGQRVFGAKQEQREYKCLDCGYTWREDIHSPLLMNANEAYSHYKKIISCKSLL